MKNMQRFIILVLLICLVPFGSVAIAESNILQNQAVDGGTINQNIIFIDVKDHWANNAINDMAKKGILSGYEDSSFKPEKSITREEFAKLIALTFSSDLTKPAAPTYTDVQPDKWSYSYVESTKDYLTGYYPPKGKAFFSPDTEATREDVAVALVKVMGFKTSDLVNGNSVDRFRDVSKISIGLRDYVAIASEKQLISGYEDGTFRPDKPITRAEVATLLFRVIKSSAQDQADGPQLDVSSPETIASATFYISGKTNRDAKVTINGKEVQVTDGAFKEGYSLEKEGTYDVTVIAKLPSGKTTTVNKQITFQVGGPTLKVDELPAAVDASSISISGSATDDNDYSPAIYINDEKVGNGSFYETVTLNEGQNVLTFKAVSSTGKQTVVTRTVTLNLNGPALKLNDIPATTNVDSISISGTATDKNDYSPEIYLNEEKIGNGSFYTTVSLAEGENTLTFKVKNSAGKTTTVVKTITFTVGGPSLKIADIPSTTDKASLSISGTATDKNDYSPEIYLNDKKIGNGTFYEAIALTEGENKLIFRVKNSLGKETVITKIIEFNVPAPKLTIGYLPTNSPTKSLTISGTAEDKNDYSPIVLLNEERLGTGSFYTSVSLSNGQNNFTFKAVNSYGKSTTVTKTVYYQQ